MEKNPNPKKDPSKQMEKQKITITTNGFVHELHEKTRKSITTKN